MFYLTMNLPLSGGGAGVKVNATGEIQFKPMVVLCEPAEACDPANACGTGYTGNACEECAKGYFRNKGNDCQMCDDDQIIGLIIMGAVCIVLSVGSFFGAMVYMKLNSDPNFKVMIQSLLAQTVKGILEPIKPALAILKKYQTRRVVVRFVATDVCSTFLWTSGKQLGMVYRADPVNRMVWVAGVLPGSPAQKMGIEPNWVLLLANQKPMRAFTDDSVTRVVGDLPLPMEMVFRAPLKKYKEEVEKVLPPGRIKMCGPVRIFTMTMGVLQSFTAIGKLSLTWPPIFKQISAFIGQFMLSFDFFHPECSVASPWEYKWMFQLIIPYLMVFPISVASMLMRTVILKVFKDLPDFCEAQSWLLTNAWARTLNSMMLVFFPMHLEQLTAPFQCISRDDGSVVMRLAQDVPCDKDFPRYMKICTIGYMGYFGAATVFAMFYTMIYNSFYWQSTMCRRDIIPVYVAMVEVATEDMFGYVKMARRFVLENVCALKMFPDGKEGRKARWLMEKLGVKFGRMSEDYGQIAQDIVKGKKRWRTPNEFPQDDDLPGNALTYGWVIIINTITRQFMLMLSVTFTCNFPPVGAAIMSLLFVINTLALLLLRPYAFDMLNWEEALCLACMGLLCWLAGFRELIMDHNRAYEFPRTIAGLSSMVDCCAVFVVSVIGGAVLNNIIMFLLAQKSKSDDEVLNLLKFQRVMKKMEIDKHMKMLENQAAMGPDKEHANEFDMDSLELEMDQLVARLAPCDRTKVAAYLQTMIDVELTARERPNSIGKAVHLLYQSKRAKVEEATLVGKWVYGTKFQYEFEIKKVASGELTYEEGNSAGVVMKAVLNLIAYPDVGYSRTYIGRVMDGRGFKEVAAVRVNVRRGVDGAKPSAVITKVLKTSQDIMDETDNDCRWEPNFGPAPTIFAHRYEDSIKAKTAMVAMYLHGRGTYEYSPSGITQSKFNIHKNLEGDLLYEEHIDSVSVLTAFLQPADLFELHGPFLIGMLKLKRATDTMHRDYGAIRMRVDPKSDTIHARVRRFCDYHVDWNDLPEVVAMRYEILVGKKYPASLGARVCLVDGYEQMTFPEGTIIAMVDGGARVQVRHDDHLGTVRYYNCGRENKFDLVFMDEAMEAIVDKRVGDEVMAQVLQLIGSWAYAGNRVYNLTMSELGHLTFEDGSLRSTLLPDGAQEFETNWVFVGQLKKGVIKCGSVMLQYDAEEGRVKAKIKPPGGKLKWSDVVEFAGERRAASSCPDILAVVGAGFYDGRYIYMEKATEEKKAVAAAKDKAEGDSDDSEEEEKKKGALEEDAFKNIYWLRIDRLAQITSHDGHWYMEPAMGTRIGNREIWSTKYEHFGAPPHQPMPSTWLMMDDNHDHWIGGNHVSVNVAPEELEEEDLSHHLHGAVVDGGRFEQSKIGKKRMPTVKVGKKVAATGNSLQEMPPEVNERFPSRESATSLLNDMQHEVLSWEEKHDMSIFLYCPDDLDYAGLYVLESREPNGFPLWKQRDGAHWIFSGSGGVSARWFVVDDQSKFDLNEGKIVSKGPHKGSQPSDMTQNWRHFNEGLGTFMDAPEIFFDAAPQLPPHLLVNADKHHAVAGQYMLVPSTIRPNDMPMWRQVGGGHYIFSGSSEVATEGVKDCEGAVWFIGGENEKADNFVENSGLMRSCRVHHGRLPHQMQLWEEYDQKSNAWTPDETGTRLCVSIPAAEVTEQMKRLKMTRAEHLQMLKDDQEKEQNGACW
jgi:hypothetical protein